MIKLQHKLSSTVVTTRPEPDLTSSVLKMPTLRKIDSYIEIDKRSRYT